MAIASTSPRVIRLVPPSTAASTAVAATVAAPPSQVCVAVATRGGRTLTSRPTRNRCWGRRISASSNRAIGRAAVTYETADAGA